MARWDSGRLRRNLSDDPAATLLVSQDPQRAQWAPHGRQAESKTGLTGHLAGRDQSGSGARIAVSLKTYETKYPKATVCLQKDREEQLTFYTFPAQHWQSLRATNPIEWTFGTIRHRTARTKDCLTREMFKLGQCAEMSWRRLRGFRQLAKVIERIRFTDGIEETAIDPVAA